MASIMTSLAAQRTASPRRPVVIVEGNIGAGKSTLCRQLAQELGWPQLVLGAELGPLPAAIRKAGESAATPVAANDVWAL